MKSINIFSNESKQSMKVFNIVSEKIKERGFLIDKNNKNAILNIVIGGDGTFLRSVHKSNYSNIPFVGINTGSLGFFQEISIDNISDFLDKYIQKKYENEKLYLLEANIKTKTKEYKHLALNEFLVRLNHSSIIKIDVFIDGNHLESFGGDALLVSTPQGSSAYNLSAGGSLMYQTLKAYQLTALAPINSKSYRSLQNSMIIPETSTLSMTFDKMNYKNNQLLLYFDGMEEIYDDITSVIKIDFKISKKYINKLVFDKNWYWLNIKDKFL